MTDYNHANNQDDLDGYVEERFGGWQKLVRATEGYRTALVEIARGETSGFELQQIAIRALAGDYNEV